MIECRDCLERLNDLLEDDFASSEASTRENLRAHLKTCADCKREFEFLSAIRQDLRSFVAVAAPADLRAQVRSNLLAEKLPNKAKKPLFALPSMRWTLSGGAVLAACCLLLFVRSSHLDESLSLPNDENSAPLSAQNFEVPSSAFEETPRQKTAPKTTTQSGKVKADSQIKTDSPGVASITIPSPTRQHQAPENPAKEAAQRPPTFAAPESKHPNSTTKTGTLPPVLAAPPKTSALQDNAPLKTQNAGANQGAADKNLADKTESQPFSAPTPAVAPPSKDKSADNERSRSTEPISNGGAMQRSGTTAPLASGQQGITGAAGAQGLAPGPQAESFSAPPSARSADAAPYKATPSNETLSNALPATPAPMMAKGADSARGPRITPRMAIAMRPDFTTTMGTTQKFKLSLVPEQEAEQAQIRLILPDGLQFADETSDAKSENSKPENSRILWQGSAQKGQVIENEVALKATAKGFKKLALTLESADGQKLQTKSVLFRVNEPQPTELPKPTAADEK